MSNRSKTVGLLDHLVGDREHSGREVEVFAVLRFMMNSNFVDCTTGNGLLALENPPDVDASLVPRLLPGRRATLPVGHRIDKTAVSVARKILLRSFLITFTWGETNRNLINPCSWSHVFVQPRI